MTPQLKDALFSVDDGVAKLSLNRDDVRNALTGTHLVEDICQAVQWCNDNTDIRCLIIGAEGKAFSAGGNIKEMRDRSGMFGGSTSEISRQYRAGIQRMSRAVFNAEVVTIAAINGPAVGAGFDLCCMCDFRIAANSARFGETFINLGIIPGDGGAWFLQRLVGYQRAAELTLSGRVFDAAEADKLGLLLERVADDELDAAADKLARSYASKPPIALRQTKRLMKTAQRQELGDFLDLCADVQAQCHHSDDHHEAVSAFLEKRPGVFKGK